MTPPSLADAVRARFPEAVTASHAFRGDATLVLRAGALLDVARFLRDDPSSRMDLLVDLTAVDYAAFGKRPSPAFFASSGVGVRLPTRGPDADPWPGPPGPDRFAVVYHFLSLALRHRLRLSVPVGAEAPEVDTLTSLWPAANWLEREVWDMFGIRFRGHPDLRRILMYEEFRGHPLRKDYPVNRRQPLLEPQGASAPPR